MRKIAKLLLTVVVLVIVNGALGAWTVLALASSGTPTPISAYYGTIVIGTTYTPSGFNAMFLYLFSTSGPFYVQKVHTESILTGPGSINLIDITIDSTIEDGLVSTCPTVVPAHRTTESGFGDIIAVTPTAITLTDPSGARAIPAAYGVSFTLVYGCTGINFPTSVSLVFEATVLAPTAATVSICASESVLSSCSGGT